MINGAEASQRDELTGTATLEAMLRFADAALELLAEDGPRVALVCVDIEGLGIINRRHGLLAGDAVLLGVADRLREGLRAHDLVGRWGGGFAVCLPDVFAAQAQGAADRLRRALTATPIPTPAGALPISGSLGLALSCHGERAAGLLGRAKAAAALAKGAGGDRVVLAG